MVLLFKISAQNHRASVYERTSQKSRLDSLKNMFLKNLNIEIKLEKCAYFAARPSVASIKNVWAKRIPHALDLALAFDFSS